MARSTADRLQSYVVLVDEIWHDVQPLIGAITLSALFASAVRHAASEHPLLSGLKATAAGLDRESLDQALNGSDPEAGLRALSELVRCLLTVFESVAGPIIVRQVIPKVIRAERDE